MRLNRHYLWLLWLIPVTLGLARLHIDSDVLDLLPSDVPAVQGLKLYQQHFANARELVVTLQAPTEEQAESAARTIATQLRRDTTRIASVTWQPPWLEQPELVAELLAYLWLNQSPPAFAELTNRLAPARLTNILNETKEFLSTSLSPFELARLAMDPYSLTKLPGGDNNTVFSMQSAQRMFSSEDGTFRLLYVRAAEDLASYQSCTAWLNSVRTNVEEARKSASTSALNKTTPTSVSPAGETAVDWPRVVVRYTGRPAFVSEMAAGMQRDMSGSVVGTALIICALFWLAHRRWAPLVWLLALLAMILVSTLALGGLVLGHVNVISLGFAAILLGLAVDYAVVHYQEAVAHPNVSIRQVRRAIAPSIVWAAVTTICAFLTLNLGGLPGLAQLGSLVAIGIALSAVVMVMVFLPPLFRNRWLQVEPNAVNVPDANSSTPTDVSDSHTAPPAATAVMDQDRRGRISLLVSGLSLAGALGFLAFKTPVIDSSANALRPTEIQADATLEEIKTRMGLPQDPMWLIVKADSGEGLHERLLEAEQFLNLAVTNKTLASFVLPTVLCPRPAMQAANRQTARTLAAMAPGWLESAKNAGFEDQSLALTRGIASTWKNAGEKPGPYWPTNTLSAWILDRCFAQATDGQLALGLLYPSTNTLSGKLRLTAPASWPQRSIWLSGWQLLGASLLERVSGRLVLVLAVMIVLVVSCLLFAFGLKREVGLSLAVLGLSLLWLLTVMSVAGWSWNLLNLMALPLVLGTGVDYSIFIQLALRRHCGDMALVRKSVGRALMLCGGTAVAGFASLAWSSYPGMASLGLLCAVGIGSNMVISVWLLPWWWRATAPYRT